jgi:hypothetical protein
MVTENIIVHFLKGVCKLEKALYRAPVREVEIVFRLQFPEESVCLLGFFGPGFLAEGAA